MKYFPLFALIIINIILKFLIDKIWLNPDWSTIRTMVSAAISSMLFFAFMALYRRFQKRREARMPKEQ